MPIPKRVRERLVAGLKTFKPVLEQQRDRDVSEADTVTVVKDVLADVFGFDKYTELTGEYAIRGTYCDLAVQIDKKLAILIEVKAIGTKLDERHVKQAVDYAANHGTEWVILTNGLEWRLYHVIFAKPIDKSLITKFALLDADIRKEQWQDLLFALTREGFVKGAHEELRDRKEATSRYLLAAVILEDDAVRSLIRRELRRVVDALIDEDEIMSVIREQVIKRDILDDAQYDAAKQRVNRLEKRSIRKSKRTATPESVPSPPD